MTELREVAVKRDALILEEREKEAARAAAKLRGVAGYPRASRRGRSTMLKGRREAALLLCGWTHRS